MIYIYNPILFMIFSTSLIKIDLFYITIHFNRETNYNLSNLIFIFINFNF